MEPNSRRANTYFCGVVVFALKPSGAEKESLPARNRGKLGDSRTAREGGTALTALVFEEGREAAPDTVGIRCGRRRTWGCDALPGRPGRGKRKKSPLEGVGETLLKAFISISQRESLIFAMANRFRNHPVLSVDGITEKNIGIGYVFFWGL